MARFYGEVGYGVSVEDPPESGTWVDQIIEKDYQGDVIRTGSNLEANQQVNENIVSSNSISIVSDQFAVDNSYNIKYVRWAGVTWTVRSVEVRSPRLILNLGSVYNGPTAS